MDDYVVVYEYNGDICMLPEPEKKEVKNYWVSLVLKLVILGVRLL